MEFASLLRPRVPAPILLLALAASFLAGSLTHAGVRLPLGITTIDEPTIVPAAIVEGIVGVLFALAAAADLARHPSAGLARGIALRAGIGGVLLGMLALAVGRGTRTELNDVFHVVALVAMLALWQATSGTGRGWACGRPGRRLTRRAT
jgi:hypothetical protein